MTNYELLPDGISYYRRLGHNPRPIQRHQGLEMDSHEQVGDS